MNIIFSKIIPIECGSAIENHFINGLLPVASGLVINPLLDSTGSMDLSYRSGSLDSKHKNIRTLLENAGSEFGQFILDNIRKQHPSVNTLKNVTIEVESIPSDPLACDIKTGIVHLNYLKLLFSSYVNSVTKHDIVEISTSFKLKYM